MNRNTAPAPVPTFADLARYMAGPDTAAWLANMARVDDWPINDDAPFLKP